MRRIAVLLAALTGIVAAAPAAADAGLRVLDRFPRAGGPVGLSGLTSVGGDRYCAVDDRGGLLYELDIRLDAAGRVRSFVTNRCVRLAGRVDLEGCAWDPLENRIWVSDERDTSVRQFDPMTGAETAAVPVPDVYRKHVRANRSLEALAISPDGLRMYAANEDTLVCDGEPATTNRGGVVRIQEFVRPGAGHPWTAARQFRYRTHRLRRGLSPHFGGLSPAGFGGLSPRLGGLSLGGVSALAVDTDGRSLLVLERQLSQSNLQIPTFFAKIVRFPLASLGTDPTGSVGTDPRNERKTIWKQDTGLANYEGLARGPVLPDGTQTWLLVSDAGGGAEASILVLGAHGGK